MKTKDSAHVLNLKIFRNFVIVTIIIALFGSMGDVIDTIFLLNFYDVNESVMASKSISDLILVILRIIPVIFSVGAQKRYGAEIAKGNTQESSKIFSVTLISTFFYSLIFVFLNFFLADKIASAIAIGGDQRFVKQTAEIIKGVSIGLPFMFINATISSMLIIDGGKKTALFSLAATLIINAISDCLVVFVFKGGLFYIFLTTSIAHFVTTLVNLSCLFRKKSLIKFNFHLKDLKILKTIIYKGSSGGANHITTALISIYMSIMLLYIGGTVALDAWGTQQQLLLIITNFTSGFFSYTFLIINIYDAEEDLKSMQQLFHVMLKIIGFIVTPLCILASIIISTVIATRNGLDPQYQKLIITCVVSCSTLIIFDSLMYIAAVFCELKKCIIIYFISFLLLPITFSLALSRMSDSSSFIIGYAIGRSLYPFIHVIIVTVKYKAFPTDVKRLFFYDEKYGFDDSNCLDYQITSIIDCMNISDKMYEFCEKHGISKQKTSIIASCAEEMSYIYIMSGFTKDLKKHYCSIRIAIKNNQIKFRMRDDCPFFLIEKMEQMMEKDSICNISYRILISRAKHIKYANFFNLNNFIITL